MNEQELIDKYTVPPTPAYIDWHNISAHEKLSEDFIREFADRVNWYWISGHQTLSKKFRKEFKHLLPNLF